MTMTVHALAGAAAGTLFGLRSERKSGREMFLFILSMLAGHVLLDKLPHNHPPVVIDAAGLLLVAICAGRSGGRVDGYAAIGMAAAVLPDLCHLLPDRFNFLHPYWLGRLDMGLPPAASQAVLAAALCSALLAVRLYRRCRKHRVDRPDMLRCGAAAPSDQPGAGPCQTL